MIFDNYSFETFKEQSVDLIVDLVNTRNPIEDMDAITTIDGLAQFLSEHPATNDGSMGGLGRPSASDLKAVRRLRSELREVFHAADEDEAARLVNAILTNAGAVPRIAFFEKTPHLYFETDSKRLARRLAAIAGVGLVEVLVDGGVDRLGTCCSEVCVDVFVDTSKNKSRRHCSTTCSNRQNVAAHRERSRAKKKS
ncbi:MAG: CGNR zinc finger domain-containing protein [Acidimicrobiia bacterium]|nr:CGNR zinc finger domain-containing protein [Acidimicrobiia bacterium]NNL28180.1 CGNR zinc finger domain-containing protein [Acidimicrobiia bacterium]